MRNNVWILINFTQSHNRAKRSTYLLVGKSLILLPDHFILETILWKRDNFVFAHVQGDTA